MSVYRAKFKKEIICEFMVPKKPSQKVIIFCDGMPSVPSKKTLMEFFWKKGFWVFHPRYRGSWESGGSFLQKSPHEDILDIIEQLPKGFKSIWDQTEYKVEAKKIFVIGASFGGTAALLSSLDERVTKVLALSPVVDWTAPSKEEPLDWFFNVVKDAFGQGYRIEKNDWKKLKTGTFFNPMSCGKEFDPEKIFLIHAEDDGIVSYRSVKKFLNKVKCKNIILKKGGHLSSKIILEKRFYKKVKEFLK